ncbi:MAG: ATP-binding protein [Xanthomonadales bacterium]|nr:ATP-binding protein [Xanthomonadales bacterium]
MQKLAEIRQGRLCLYGPPGTGKSAWAQYLAERLGVPMLQKRASDLLSKWVGDNEKHIAAAFAEAAREGALLLIDEADSLLHDRRKAQQRWQVAQVNELLTQIEIYDGLLVICTNLYEDLDPAALRRFDIRAEFAYLRPEQATALLDECIDRHGIPVDAPSLAAAQQRLQRLDRLTPGDFQTVLRRNRPIGFHRVARRSRRQRLGASAAVAIAQCTLPSDLVAISSSVARCAAIRSAIRA